MKRAFTTYAVILQVVAILLLQWYTIAPHLSRKPARLQCSGDHRLCGCAPEKIASHTCCCSRHKPVCHDEDGHHEEGHHEKDHLAKRDGNPSPPYLSTAPCGDTTKFMTASLEKLKFFCPEVPSLPPSGYFQSYPLPGPETATDRFTEPPVPPPQPVLVS